MSFIFTLIAAFVVVAGGFVQGQKLQKRHVRNTIVRGVQKQSVAKQDIQRNKIQKLDPFFSESQIKSRIEQAFFIIKEAFSQQDSRPATAFISDGVAESMQIMFEIQQHRQRKRPIENLSLLTCELVGMEADKHAETLHFKIDSRAAYPVIHTDQSKLHQPANIAKPLPLVILTEYWTYVRLPGTQTRQGAGLIEGVCPNCGQTLVLSQFSLCEACGSLVGSGEYDWILTKITSEAQWRFQNAKRQIVGVAEYQVVDPAFNVPLVEDRVSAIFWRIQKAWLMQKTDPLLSVATPDFVEQFKEQLQGYCFDHIALGLCEVSRVLFADQGEDQFDRIHLLIKWQGNRVDLNSNDSDKKGFYAHHMTLIRQSGIKSDSKKGLHSLHCFGCGAPQTQSYQDCCEYCGGRFNSGEQSWIVERFEPHLEHVFNVKGRQFIVEKQTEKRQDRIFDPVSLLSSLVLVLYANGEVSEQEQALLDEFVKHRRIPRQVLDDVLAAAKAGQLDMLVPDETLDASDWINKLIEMCLADGEVCEQERQLLINFGEKFNILPIDIELRIKQIQRKMYVKNKQILANSKG